MGTNMQDIQFLSTLSLRRATLLFWGEQYGGKISIHALLAESDGASNNPQHLPLAISIHALLAESDRHIFQVFAAAVIISIHALLAESDGQLGGQRQPPAISIHALLAESDTDSGGGSGGITPFLSTLSLRRATKLWWPFAVTQSISIHALLAESDWAVGAAARPREVFLSTLSLRRATRCLRRRFCPRRNFYPRSPCGERPRPAAPGHTSA